MRAISSAMQFETSAPALLPYVQKLALHAMTELVCRQIQDQVIVSRKKQKTAPQIEQTEAPRPVSKSEQRKLKQIERRKEAQARVRGTQLSACSSLGHM